MPDENNPTIYIEYSAEAFPPVSWESLKTYALSFNVKNSGILKTPEATLILKNTGGRYTGNGALTLQSHKFIRIRADVRDTIDTLFYGRIASLQSSSKKKKAEKLTITTRGMTQKLLWDVISHDYLTEQNEGSEDRTMFQVIAHFLENPNSGEDTNINLVSSGTPITTVKAKHNFDRQTLLAAINQICEYIGYTGYEEVAGSNVNLYLRPYGWEATNPTITIPASEADRKNILEREYLISLDEVYNHICVWAGMQLAYPDRDRFTEKGVEKGYWTAGNVATTVVDNTEQVTLNNKSIKITTTGEYITLATMDMSSLFPTGIDIKDIWIQTLCFWLYVDRNTYMAGDLGAYVFEPEIILEDSNGDKIAWKCKPPHHKRNDYTRYEVPLGKTTTDGNYEYERIHVGFDTRNVWRFYAPSTTFNWKIKKITFTAEILGLAIPKFNAWYIDGLCFEGAIECDPVKDPALAATDADSIAAYGRRLMDFDQLSVRDYDAIKALADKILETTKNPLIKLKLKYGAKTWIKPNQTVTVDLPVYGITGTPAAKKTFRIVEFTHEWSTKTKLLRTTFGLTQQYLPPEYTIVRPITSREWYAGALEGIIKELLW